MYSFVPIEEGKKSSTLLLVFNGWGMDEHPLLPFILKQCPVDCLILSAHNDDHREIVHSSLERYQKVHLIAFSLGVPVAHSLLAGQEAFVQKKGYAVAINGTLDPLSIENGIDPDVFSRMIESLSPSSVAEFTKTMCRKDYSFYDHNLPQRPFMSQKDELIYLHGSMCPVTEDESFFDLAIIAKGDMIIPAKAQENYWRNTAKHKIIAPHFPFTKLKSLWNVIEIAKSSIVEDVDAG